MPEATTMQLSDHEGADEPLGRFRAGWRLKARHAKDTWDSGTQSIEAALEDTFHDGIKFAADFLEAEGHKELAGKLRACVQRRA
jgi:hypothetical protein